MTNSNAVVPNSRVSNTMESGFSLELPVAWSVLVFGFIWLALSSRPQRLRWRILQLLADRATTENCLQPGNRFDAVNAG